MYSYKIITHINEISATRWDLFFDDNPFTKHAFIHACEASLSASSKQGWQAHHFLIYENDTLIAVMPGYVKSHSYGEYVFDWSWAEAYQNHGLTYYPKWVCSIPFTPVEGGRIATNSSNLSMLYQYIKTILNAQSKKYNWSGFHINFCDKKTSHLLGKQDVSSRLGVQFQWFNKDYQSFDDYLSCLTARKRKVIKKERLKAVAEDISIKWLTGCKISSDIIEQFIAFYQRTYLKRSGHLGYLNSDFFSLLKQNMSDELVIMIATKDENVIAATLSLKSSTTLYGRYWGASEYYDFLHFELCYYQGIEYCIKNNLKCFHSGAQGEHKIARGFEPVFTYSNHTMVHPDFSLAIDNFLIHESQQMQNYHQQCQTLLPFKNQ
ncbi:GNAT family N-acetyltransferase [Pseudoalteromonas denitrificans]|uniref:N-acetyltransferase n=1 Tax=Pseudoalteromonas denitrificans DSM 6059 TaxID=1123010 RepID=A0A1I1MZN9_9GAMM|nr:GNAT family N-acetyltransferase [Pseudoalteromonas denitrificans]SFC90566.1 hypothetical protein SAMN02745724_02889 [Pseudoalteromonas denitrificans DSM 6059]